MKVVLFANTDWYLYNFRRSLALALQESGYEVLLISPAGRYGEALRAMGLRWEPVPMNRRSLNPLREFALLCWLWRLLRNERPMLVHGFTIKCAVYGALAARFAIVPARVSAVAGTGYVFASDHLRARLLRPFVRGLLRVALSGGRSRLILQNHDDVALFTSEGVMEASRIRLIQGSGVDCLRFALHRTDHDQNRPLRVLLAARLVWPKGIAEFAEAARRLRAEGRRLEFLLAGEPDPGNPAAVPEGVVHAWQAEGVLRWLGHVDDMPDLLTRADLVVLPSYGGEGIPRSLIEAAACGLPLIATDVAGCREVVTDGVEGLLVPPRNSSALADAIRRIDDDRSLARRLGAAAREKAVREFDERIVIDQTLHVYAELLPGPRDERQISPKVLSQQI